MKYILIAAVSLIFSRPALAMTASSSRDTAKAVASPAVDAVSRRLPALNTDVNLRISPALSGVDTLEAPQQAAAVENGATPEAAIAEKTSDMAAAVSKAAQAKTVDKSAETLR